MILCKKAVKQFELTNDLGELLVICCNTEKYLFLPSDGR